MNNIAMTNAGELIVNLVIKNHVKKHVVNLLARIIKVARINFAFNDSLYRLRTFTGSECVILDKICVSNRSDIIRA